MEKIGSGGDMVTTKSEGNFLLNFSCCLRKSNTNVVLDFFLSNKHNNVQCYMEKVKEKIRRVFLFLVFAPMFVFPPSVHLNLVDLSNRFVSSLKREKTSITVHIREGDTMPNNLFKKMFYSFFFFKINCSDSTKEQNDCSIFISHDIKKKKLSPSNFSLYSLALSIGCIIATPPSGDELSTDI